MPWDRVHDEAEVLEHVLSEELEALIAAKLGHPTHDPHGDPIPTPDLTIDERDTVCLQDLDAGDRGVFVRISDSDPEMLRYLGERGIAPGDRFEVVEKQPFGGPVFVRFGGDDARARRSAGAGDAGRGVGVTPPPPPPAVADPGVVALPAPSVSQLQQARSRGRLRGAIAVLGPAFVACIAYVDPGNFATNIAGGAKFGYLLLWVLLAANLMAMLIQNLSAKIGIATGKNLPGALPRALPAAGDGRAVGPGRADRHGHRPRRVRRRGDRAEPAVRRAAVPRRPDHRRRRVRDPRAAGPRLPALRARDHGVPRRHHPRLPLRHAAHRLRRRRGGARVHPRASPAPRASCSPPASSARP